jgi:long-chain acyl-CoA synthetase
MNVGQLITRAAEKFPSKTAIIQDGLSFSYAEFNQRINRLAGALSGLGLKKGERIGVLLKNCHQFLEIYFAAAKIGAIFCPYNYMLTPAELKGLMEYSSPRFLFYGPEFDSIMPDTAGQVAAVEKAICLEAPAGSQALDYEALLAAGDEAEPMAEVGGLDVMSIFFTSGTTGLPKGAMRSHRHVLSTAVTGLIENQISYGEITLIATPMYHVAFEDLIGRCFFVPNTSVVYTQAFDPAGVLACLAEQKITNCLMVPTMIAALLNTPEIETAELSHLKRIFYVGAPMPVELLRQALKVFGRYGTGFCQQYGQTETGPLTTILRPEDHVADGPEHLVKRLASAGKPVLDYQVRIMDEDGGITPGGEVGEIAVKSEAMMLGYWRLPDKTAEKMKDGWLLTGDMGYVDQDGYIFIVDRKDDLIISGGKNIYPREVEEALYEHPAVLEAVVVGVPDDYWGEAVKAVVALKPGAEAGADEIQEFCAGKLARYKAPKTLEVWEDLPKSATGKLLRRKVREVYWEGSGRKI